MGWVIGSREAATYVHLSGRDTDKAILEMYGVIEEEKKQETTFKPIDCPRCGIKNDPASKFCSGCSLGLDEKSIMEYDQKKEEATKVGMNVQQVMNSPEILRKMIDMLSNQLEKTIK